MGNIKTPSQVYLKHVPGGIQINFLALYVNEIAKGMLKISTQALHRFSLQKLQK